MNQKRDNKMNVDVMNAVLDELAERGKWPEQPIGSRYYPHRTLACETDKGERVTIRYGFINPVQSLAQISGSRSLTKKPEYSVRIPGRVTIFRDRREGRLSQLCSDLRGSLPPLERWRDVTAV